MKEFRRVDSMTRSQLIEIFMQAGKGTAECQQCKAEIILPFREDFLSYDKTKKVCTKCETKIIAAEKAQKLDDKLKALEKFRGQMEEIIKAMLLKAGVPDDFMSASMRDLGLDAAKSFKVTESYYLEGDVGVGKSHMAVALLRQYIESLEPEYNEATTTFYFDDIKSLCPIFIEVPELLLEIRDSYKEKSSMSEKEIVDYYTKTPFLVLDDLGTEKASEFSTLMIYLIINRRCTSGKTTVITSNLSLVDIKERLSERISSRIKGMCREIDVAGNDKRY